MDMRLISDGFISTGGNHFVVDKMSFELRSELGKLSHGGANLKKCGFASLEVATPTRGMKLKCSCNECGG